MSDTLPLLEHLQDDQALRWQGGERPLVESYLAAHPELAGDSTAVLDLLNHELLLREEREEAPTLAEYVDRFPHLAGALREMFEVHAVLEAEMPTAVTSAAPPPRGLPEVPGHEMVRELGRGGMGIVYLAWQTGPHRLVALKMIRAGAGASPTELARFHTEAEAAARLEHPNIVRLYEAGTQDGCPYFALEYVDGGSLAAALRGTPQPPRVAAELLETLARAVHYAHQRGVVHRDLTPNNILLSLSGRSESGAGEASPAPLSERPLNDCVPKITDFGLARLLVGGSSQTQTGDVLGTPSYLAPEQAAGGTKQAGPTTDVYALGAILYEMLTGRPPFRGATAVDTLLQVTAADPIPPRRLQPGLPRDLETVCLKCLEKEPRKRYASAQALAEDLRRFLDNRSLQARPAGAWERGRKWVRRRPAVATLLALSAAVLLIGFPLVSWQWLQTQFAWQAEHEQREAADLARQAEHEQREAADQARQAEHEQREATDAALRGEAEQRQRFQALSARLLRDRGLHLCDEGDVGRGLLCLVDALELVPDQDEDLRRAIRTNLAAAEGQVHPVQALLGHERFVLAVAWAADGRTIASGGHDKKVRLWDAVTGTCRREFDHPFSVRCLALSADGRTLLTATNRGAYLWDAATGNSLPCAGLDKEAGVLAVALTRDGTKALTGSARGVVRLWNVTAGQLLSELSGPRTAVRVVAFSPDGKTILAAGDDPTAFLWTDMGDLVGRLPQERKVADAAFSPDGQTVLTGGSDGTARLWDSTTAQPRTALDPETQMLRPVVLRHPGPVTAVAFSADGKRVVIAGVDHSAQVWTATGQPRGQPLQHQGSVAAVAFSPDGRTVLTGGWDQAARLWDAATGRPVGALLPHQSEVTRVAFLLDGHTLLTFSRDRTVRLWQMTARPPEPLRHERWVTAVAFSPDGQTALTASADTTVRLWDTATGRQRGESLKHPHFVLAAAFAPDGRTIATGCEDKAARVWDAVTGQCLGDALVHPDRVRAVAFSPDGRTLLTGCEDTKVRLWDLTTGRVLQTVKGHGAAVYAVAFSPDGRTFLTGSEDQTARLWDTATCRLLGAPLTHLGTVRAVAYSRDGQTLLTGSEDRTARLWRTETGEALGAPLLHPRSVLAVAFGAGDRLVLTGCQDEEARLWDRASGHPVGLPFHHSRPVRAVAFHPDGKVVLTGCEDSKARFWPVPEPVTEEVARLRLREQVLSGMELDVHGAVRALDAAGWMRRQHELQREK